MNVITIIQIIVSLILIGLILIQSRGGDAGGVFGGGGGTSFYQKRRGMEKMIFAATILLTVSFAGLALLNLVLSVS